MWEDPWIATAVGSVTFIVMGVLGMALLFACRWAFSRIQRIRQTSYIFVLLAAIPGSICFALLGLHGGVWAVAMVFAGFFWFFALALSTMHSMGDLHRLMRSIRPERVPGA